jgi:hypothetical protein
MMGNKNLQPPIQLVVLSLFECFSFQPKKIKYAKLLAHKLPALPKTADARICLPTLHMPEPLSTTRAATSSSHIIVAGVYGL